MEIQDFLVMQPYIVLQWNIIAIGHLQRLEKILHPIQKSKSFVKGLKILNPQSFLKGLEIPHQILNPIL